MRTLLVILSFFPSVNASSQDSWQLINYSEAINDFQMFDASNGVFLAGNIMFKTSDSGLTWNFIGQFNSHAMHFIDKDTGWQVGGVIAKTVDGGVNWDIQNGPAPCCYRDIYMVNALNGWLVGIEGKAYRTLNGGTTWFSVQLTTSEDLNNIFFINNDLGWIVGDDGVIFKTQDGGANWFSIDNDVPSDILTIYFVTNQHGWITTLFGNVFESFDGGETWAQVDINFSTTFNSLFFLTENTGWACGSNAGQSTGRLFHTQNSGLSWAPLNLTIIDNINKIQFLSEQVGWGVGGKNNNNSAFISTIDGGQTWLEIESLPQGDIYGVSRVGVRIFAIATGAKIFKSLDNGLNWTLISTPNWGSGVGVLDFVSPSVGWAVLSSNRLAKTTNGGVDWTTQTLPGAGGLWSCEFIDANTGWLVGWPAKVLKTMNGGQTWAEQQTFLSAQTSFTDVFFSNSTVGWIVGNFGHILRTSNGGATWIDESLDDITDLNTVYFVNNNVGWVSGASGVIYRSINGGDTWDAQVSGTNASLESIYFLDENIGWIIGNANSAGIALTTSDGGLTWNIQDIALPNVFEITGDSNKTPIVVGEDGFVAKIITTSTVGFDYENKIETTKFIVYPNPFSNYFNISKNGNSINYNLVEVVVTNIFGHTVASFMFQGNNMRQENTELPNGIYFIQFIEKGNVIDTQLLLKQSPR